MLQSIPWGVDQMRYSKERSIMIIVSLMKNQVRAMTERNIQTVFVRDADDEEVKYC